MQAAVDKACALHKRQAALNAMRQVSAGARSVAAAAVATQVQVTRDEASGTGVIGVSPTIQSSETSVTAARGRPCGGTDRQGYDSSDLRHHAVGNAQPVTQLFADGGVSRLSVLEDQLEAVQQTLRDLQTGYPRVNPAMNGCAASRSDDRATRLSRGAAMGPRSQRGRCWTCGDQGHYARECPRSRER